jgi:hypothetical protein
MEPGLGWYYTGFLQALANDPGMSGAMLGKIICDTYFQACKIRGQGADITLSVIDLSRVGALMRAYHNIGAESLLYACNNSSFINDFGRAAHSAQFYGYNNSRDGFTNMVDLGDLVIQAGDALLPRYSSELLAALDDCVVYQIKGPYRQRASGLSCYYSYNANYGEFLEYAALTGDDSPFRWFYDYSISGELSAEGLEFAKSLTANYETTGAFVPEPVITPSEREIDLEDYPITVDADGNVTLDLGAFNAATLVAVYSNLAYFNPDTELIIYLGMDNSLDENWKLGIFTGSFRGTWAGIDGALCYMELIDVTDQYRLYTVPILLNGEQYSLSVGYRFASREYLILGARKGLEESGMADRNMIQLEPGDIVEPLHYSTYLYSSDDEDFELSSFESVTITENTRFENLDLDDGWYVYMFEMIDVQNNSYLSEAVIFGLKNGEITLLSD